MQKGNGFSFGTSVVMHLFQWNKALDRIILYLDNVVKCICQWCLTPVKGTQQSPLNPQSPILGGRGGGGDIGEGTFPFKNNYTFKH